MGKNYYSRISIYVECHFVISKEEKKFKCLLNHIEAYYTTNLGIIKTKMPR